MDKGIAVINIFGEVEGHNSLPGGAKTTKYEEIIPWCAGIELNDDIKGVLVLINTTGGDVESGLSIAEALASVSKPVVTVVLGGGHSIGVPLAVAGDYSFIVKTATMIVHPIRVAGVTLGARQNFYYIEKMQDRIIDFIVSHSDITEDQVKTLMFNTKELSKDIGSVLVGAQAVKCGIIKSEGGLSDAVNKLYDLIKNENNSRIS